MGIGTSTLSKFLLTAQAREALVGFRLVVNDTLPLGKARRLAIRLAEGLGPAWSGYVYRRANGLAVIVVESAECGAV